MAKITQTGAGNILSAAVKRKGANIGNLTAPELVNLPDVLVKMIVASTFKDKFGYWDNLFTGLANLKDEVGAMNKIFDVGLLTLEDDVITKAEDLMPNLGAVPTQYAATFLLNFEKRIELMIDNAIYKKAFTSISAFGDFISLLKNQIGNTLYVFMYKAVQKQIEVDVLNQKDLSKKRTIELTIIDFFNGISLDLSSEVPFTDTLNLGASKDLDPLNIVARKGGIDKTTPVKENTINFVKTDNGMYFPDFNLIMSGDLSVKLTNELAATYHSNFIDISKRYNGIIPMTNEVSKAIEAKIPADNDLYCILIDKGALFLSNRLDVMKEQFWAKGSGSGLMQLVRSVWFTLATNPWANGRLYYGSTTKK